MIARSRSSLTIRTRLAVAYGAAVAITIVVVALVVWWRFGGALRSSMAEQVEVRIVALDSVLAAGDTTDLGADVNPDVWAALVAADGTVVDRSPQAPLELLVEGAADERQELASGGRRYLVLSAATAGDRIIVAGADMASIDRAQTSLAGVIGLAGTLATILSAAGGWWLAGRTLRPVADLTAEAAAIGATDPGRRLHQPPRDDELGALARTLNEMLDRVQDAVVRQRAFVVAASHDLRTPLAALQTELELADHPDADAAELHAALRAARDDAARLGELAADLLDLANVAGDGRELVRAPVALADVSDAVIRRVGPIAERSGVMLATTVADDVAHLDRVRLEQALTNLLVNAVTYAPAGSTVEIHGAVRTAREEHEEHEEREVVLGVLDRGPGIPDSERQVIFEPFRRGAAARGNGSGLGLATARAAVEAHGGTLSAEPREGGGTAFWLRIPGAPPVR